MLYFYARVDLSYFDFTTPQLLISESGTVSIHFQLVASYYSLLNGHLNIKYSRDA